MRAWACAGALLFFVAASLLFIGRQGLHDDEGSRGVHALGFFHNLDNPVIRNWHFMESYYIGSVNSLLLVPGVRVLGAVPLAVHLPFVVLGLGAMGLVFLSLRRLFHTPVALLTVCLLAVNSTFIRVVRNGGCREEILQIFLFWLVMALLLVPRRPWRVGAAFAAGLALWTKVMFLGYLLGMGAAVAAFGAPWKERGAAGEAARGGGWAAVPACAAAFAAGLAPLLYWNAVNGWETFGRLFHAFWRTRGPAAALCDNAHFACNLQERLFHLLQLLTSQIPFDDLDGIADAGFNPVYLFLAVASAAGVLVFLAARPAARPDRDRLGFFAAVYAVLFVCTCFAPVGRYAGHLAILFPFPELVVAFCFCRVLAVRPGGGGAAAWARPLAAACIVAHAAAEMAVTARVIDGIRRGRAADYAVSPAMFPIARALCAGQAQSLVTFCNEMGLNVGYLCADRVQVHYVPDAAPADSPALVSELLGLPQPVFLLTLDGERAPEVLRAWFDVWRNAGTPPEPFQVFTRQGRVFRLYRVGPRRAAVPAPAPVRPADGRDPGGAAGESRLVGRPAVRFFASGGPTLRRLPPGTRF